MNFILMLMPWLWGAIFVVTLLIKFKTSDIDVLWFSTSSLVTLIISLITPNLSFIWQLLMFIGITLILSLTLGKWAKRRVRLKNISINADALVGRKILILEDCNEFDKGSGSIDNAVWSTICKSGHSLKKGEEAIIIAIDGNSLVIKEDKD